MTLLHSSTRYSTKYWRYHNGNGGLRSAAWHWCVRLTLFPTSLFSAALRSSLSHGAIIFFKSRIFCSPCIHMLTVTVTPRVKGSKDFKSFILILFSSVGGSIFGLGILVTAVATVLFITRKTLTRKQVCPCICPNIRPCVNLTIRLFNYVSQFVCLWMPMVTTAHEYQCYDSNRMACVKVFVSHYKKIMCLWRRPD